MAALVCEFCGGKLITKAGGICECDSCGMEFDKSWVREKIQEIKGTVKVEGTVEVQGTVKLDGPVEVKGGINTENLIKRGKLALEDGKWADANAFFDEALNYDPECAEAYVGKTLAQEYCKTLDDFVEKRISLDGRTEAKFASISAAKAHIQEMVDKYEIKNYLNANEIKNLYKFDFSYEKCAPAYQSKLSEEEAYWINHKLLSRAENFGAREIAKSLRNAKEKVLSALHENIKLAEKADIAARQSLEKRYAVHLAETDEKVAQMYADAEELRESTYQHLAEIARTEIRIPPLERTIHALAKLDNYKDSSALITLCNNRIDEITSAKNAETVQKNRLRAIEDEQKRKQEASKIVELNAEKEKLQAKLSTLKVTFSAACRKKIEVRLAEIEEELEELGCIHESF